VLFVVSTLLSGCGSGGSVSSGRSVSSGGSSAPSAQAADPAGSGSAAQVVAKAESLCKTLTQEFKASSPPKVTDPVIAKVSPVRAAQEKQLVDSLARLHVSAPGWTHVLVLRTELAEELVELGKAAAEEDQPQINALAAKKRKLHKQVATAAKKSGVPACGES
jgi:hypothetical protein